MSKKKNFFSEWKNELSFNQWENIVGNLEYKVVTPDELPDFFKQNPITKTFNSALIASSGSKEAHFFTIIGFRPDEGDTVMDQEPYVVLFDKTLSGVTGSAYSGFIHHGSFPDRTVPIDPKMTQLLSLCSVTASISCSSIPNQKQGALEDLGKTGLLTGTKFAFNQAEKNYKKKKNNP